MKTNQLFDFIHNKAIGSDLMAKAQQVDTNANGVQVWGSEEVTKVALGVSCNLEFLEKAARWGAQVCLFHHGLALSQFGIYNSCPIPSLDKQLNFVYNHELTVAGYHFTLDAHPTLGNNAQIIEKLGAKRLDLPYFDEWGWVGEFDTPIDVQKLAKDCSQLFRHDVFMVLAANQSIKRIGVCSGCALPQTKNYFEIIEKNIDLHLTGEISEWNPAQAKESGFNYFACGHYATEVFGIQALGDAIKKQFPNLEVQFIDVWNSL